VPPLPPFWHPEDEEAVQAAGLDQKRGAGDEKVKAEKAAKKARQRAKKEAERAAVQSATCKREDEDDDYPEEYKEGDAQEEEEEEEDKLKLDTYKHYCIECEQYLPASKLLLLSEDINLQEWCGQLQVKCKECCNFQNTEKAFRKLTKARWTMRAVDLHNKPKRLRCMTWTKLEEEFKQKYPLMHDADRRRLQIMKIKLVAVRFAEGLTKSPELAAVSELLSKNYMNEIEAAAKNPHHVVKMKSLVLNAPHEAQYLNRLTDTLSLSFICRSCGCFGPDWGKSVSSWHFRCYSCGTFYRPGVVKAGWSEYNMMLLLEEDDGLVFLPCLWPASAEENWLRQHAEAYALNNMVKAGQADRILTSASIGIKQLIDAAGTTAAWQRFAFTPAAQQQFNGPKWPLEAFQDTVAQGFLGMHFRPAPGEKIQVFTDWDALIAFVGQLIAAARATSRL
jgi:hypothetical protein